MTAIFISVLNMSITASYVILLVMLVRLLLKRAPRMISYALWFVVGVRLLIPVSFASVLSIFPKNMSKTSVPLSAVYQGRNTIYDSLTSLDSFSKTAPSVVINGAKLVSLELYTEIGALIWVIGLVSLLIYAFISIFLLRKALGSAKRVEGNIYEVEGLKTPFVFGLIKPKIYLPRGLDEVEREFVLLHEQVHIRRGDPIIKLVAFFILSIHWFNPLVWIAFKQMNLDMELSCDERVLKERAEDIKKTYANSLLALAVEKETFGSGVLAFGEGDIRARIKNILRYRKPKGWITFFSIVLVILVGIGLLLNPKITELEKQKSGDTLKIPRDKTEAAAHRSIEIGTPKLALDQDLGVAMPELDYASDRIVIFHSYFGLFVYDVEKKEILRSVDLKQINCDQIQGSNYCDVSVSPDGETVYLHPMESKNMYIYSVSAHTLREAPFKRLENRYKGVSIEEAIQTKELGNYSYNAAKLGAKEFGYLFASDWKVGKLTYVRGDMMFEIFNAKD